MLEWTASHLRRKNTRIKYNLVNTEKLPPRDNSFQVSLLTQQVKGKALYSLHFI